MNMEQVNLDPYSHHTMKIKSRCILDLNIKVKATKFLEENSEILL